MILSAMLSTIDINVNDISSMLSTVESNVNDISTMLSAVDIVEFYRMMYTPNFNQSCCLWLLKSLTYRLFTLNLNVLTM